MLINRINRIINYTRIINIQHTCNVLTSAYSLHVFFVRLYSKVLKTNYYYNMEVIKRIVLK